MTFSSILEICDALAAETIGAIEPCDIAILCDHSLPISSNIDSNTAPSLQGVKNRVTTVKFCFAQLKWHVYL
jgi:hypothetical protein